MLRILEHAETADGCKLTAQQLAATPTATATITDPMLRVLRQAETADGRKLTAQQLATTRRNRTPAVNSRATLATSDLRPT